MAICSTGTSAPPLGLELCVPEGKPRVVLALLQALILPRGDILSITYVTSNYELQSLLNEWSIPSSKTQDRPSSGAISPCRRRVPPAAEAHHPRRGADSGQLSGLRPPRALRSLFTWRGLRPSSQMKSFVQDRVEQVKCAGATVSPIAGATSRDLTSIEAAITAEEAFPGALG